MGLYPSALLLALSFVVYLFYKRWARVSFPHIPGPESRSWSLGNMGELLQSEAALTDFKWQELYGNVVRFKAPLNNDRLLISDPKALQYILQTSGYKWQKLPERRELSRLSSGKGILWSDGDVHKRHRKVMLPGFGFPEIRNFVPIFFSCAKSMSAKWRDLITANADQPIIIDIPESVSRVTMDAVGRAAFDYEFGAVEDDHNELKEAFRNIIHAAFGSPSDGVIIGLDAAQYLPTIVLEAITNNISNKRLEPLRRAAAAADKISKELIDMKAADLLEGKSKKDIMSILVKANASENPKARLSDTEMIAQMRNLILAGHETVANSITWTMLELSRHPEMQTKLRKEIQETEHKLGAQGKVEFTAHDLETMSYLNAVVKETLRFHPVIMHMFRGAVQDDVLPLSKPVTTTTGKIITELPVPKGTRVVISMHAYNRDKEIFGEDAHTYNPDRWLTPGHVKTSVPLGVYANLATFSAGVRSCIGWRFAVVELQTLLVEMIRNFEFSKTPEIDKVHRAASFAMIPVIEGEVEKGIQLPLKVGFAPRED